MKFSPSITLPLLASVMAFSASAEYEADSVYAGLSLNAYSYDTDEIEKGYNEISDFYNEIGGHFNASVDNTDTGFKLFVGYQLADNFAAEFGYLDAGEMSTDVDYEVSYTFAGNEFTSAGNGQGVLGVTGLSASAVGNYAFTEEFTGFVKLGVLSWEATNKVQFSSLDMDGMTENLSESTTVSGEDLVYSVGVSYDFDDIAIYGEYEVLTIENDDSNESDEFDDVDEDDSNTLDLSSFNIGIRYVF